MAKRQPGAPRQGRFRHGIKAPLLFSAALGVIAGVATSIFATGGGGNVLRVDLGITAGGVAFIASLVICAMLMMAETPNPEHLGKGSGINRISSRPDRQPARSDAGGATTENSAKPADTADIPGVPDAPGTQETPEPPVDEPRFGQRLPNQGL